MNAHFWEHLLYHILPNCRTNICKSSSINFNFTNAQHSAETLFNVFMFSHMLNMRVFKGQFIYYTSSFKTDIIKRLTKLINQVSLFRKSSFSSWLCPVLCLIDGNRAVIVTSHANACGSTFNTPLTEMCLKFIFFYL